MALPAVLVPCAPAMISLGILDFISSIACDVVSGYHRERRDPVRWNYRQSRLSKLSSAPGIKHAHRLFMGYLVGRFNPPPVME
jgi:hypothetical protein